MKRLFLLPILMIAVSLGFQSCNNGKTYAELKEEEEDAIQKYITENDINVISEDEFLKDTVTDVSKNEYVFLEKNGVYMQIVQRGEGELLKEGSYDISSRFVEVYLKEVEAGSDVIHPGDTVGFNLYDPLSECMRLDVQDKNTFSGKFTSSSSSYVMPTIYQSQAVPSGWLIPFAYLKMKKYISAPPTEKKARVKLIVPHSEGTSMALQSVYPCFYDITYSLH